MISSDDHWAEHAKRWAHVRPPLRPCEEDIRLVGELLRRALPEHQPARILLLGVTPELATLPLTPNAELIAVEQNAAMIEHVFPPGAGRRVVHGTWQALPIETNSIDVVLGDGCFTTLPTRDAYQAVCREIARVSKSTGAFLHRFFVRPDADETPDRVLSDLNARLIPSLEVFKWRLAMSLVDTETAAVRLSDIWNQIEEHTGGNLLALTELGFPEASIRTLEHYRGVEKLYSFPRRDQLLRWIEPTLELDELREPEYVLGERCLHMLWRRGQAV